MSEEKKEVFPTALKDYNSRIKAERKVDGETKKKTITTIIYPSLYRRMKMAWYMNDVSVSKTICALLEKWCDENEEAIQEFIKKYGEIDM